MIKCKRQKKKQKNFLKKQFFGWQKAPPLCPPKKVKIMKRIKREKRTQESMRQQNTFRFKTRGIKEKTPKRVSTLNTVTHTHTELNCTPQPPSPILRFSLSARALYTPITRNVARPARLTGARLQTSPTTLNPPPLPTKVRGLHTHAHNLGAECRSVYELQSDGFCH